MRPPVVATGQGAVALSRRSEAVLVRLLMDAGEVVSIDRLAEFVWGDDPPRTARNSIARFVADIRIALGDAAERLVTDGRGYRLVVHPGELDWDRAQGLLRTAQLGGTDDEQAVALLTEANALAGSVPNPILAELPNAGARIRLHKELRIEILEEYAERQLRRGRHRELVAVLEGAVEGHPYHERLWELLIVALHRSGRATDAIRASRRLGSTLAEIGMEPSASIRRIEGEILTGQRAELATESGHRRAAPVAVAPGGLPEPTTPLVGRSEEVDALEQAMRDAPIVTVIGLGGSGKTRLALAVAGQRELDGRTVHRVGLRSVDVHDRVVPAIATAIGIPGSAAVSDPASLARALAPHAVDLVLDNCEQVTDGCVAVIEALRDAAPDVRILATSRVPLGVPDEHLLRLQPLRLPTAGDPSPDAPAMALFLDRAHQHLANSDPDPDLLDNAGELCRRLAGLPLAIELATAQLRGRSIEELLASVRMSGTGTRSSGDAAGAAVAATIEWSWDLLSSRQQLLLARLSVFRGGWTLDAADAVCADRGSVEVDLDELVDVSLVQRSWGPTGHRYDMLEPVHAWAVERLADFGEKVARPDRLVGWIEGLTERWGDAELQAWAEPSVVLLPELGNISAALEHLTEQHRPEELVRLASRSCGVWINHGSPDEVFRWLLPLVDDPFISDDARSGAAAMVMQAFHAQGELASLSSWGMKSLELAGGRPLDWVPAVAGFLSVWSRVYPVPLSLDQLQTIARDAVDDSPSPGVNRALTAMYRAHVEFGQRSYDDAATSFRVGQELNRVPGRLLLLCEAGEALSLFMAGRRQEAAGAARSWRSRADTDQWHYLVHIVRAVVTGGAGDPAEATVQLAAAIRRLPAAAVWGQADDFQTAFGLLAAYRGEHTLSAQLLATPITRHILLATVVVEHVAAERGLTDEAGLVQVALELWTRHFPEGVRGGDITSADELVDWWATGRL